MMGHTRGVLPRMDNVVDDFIHPHAVLHLRKDEWAVAAHLLRVTRHYIKVSADTRREVGFVDDEQIGLRDAGTAFARDFVSATNVDDLDREVGQFPAEARREIVAA